MTRPRRWSSELLPMICIVVVGVAFLALPVMVGIGTWQAHLTLRRDWAIAGPPCPQVAQVSIAARGMHPPPPFTYLGAHFTPQIGNVSCEAVPDDGWFPQTAHPVCQFSAPGAVEVQASARRVVYEVGVGRPATVTVRDGRPSCVVGGWFRY